MWGDSVCHKRVLCYFSFFLVIVFPLLFLFFFFFVLVVSVCFNCFIFSQLEIKPDKRRIIVLQDPWWPIAFQNALCQSFFRHQCPGVQFVDSLHCAVFSTGQDTALVVDVGYHCTKIEATMFGHIIPESLSWSPIGFYSVMSEFKILMRESTKLDFDKFRVEDEQIEKAIARTCFVQPKRISKDSNNNNSESANFHPKSVSYEFNVRKQSAFCKIAPSIRRKSCQVLFDPERRNVVHFICDTLLKLPIDCRGALVNNILLTGGTVSLPGFESRFIEEWKDAMKLPKYKELSNLGHRMRLIKSSFEPNTRMFVGASIYANITNRFADELFITREQFEELKKNRIEDWSEISTLRYNEYVSSKKEEYNKLSIIDIEASSSSQSVIAAKKDFQNAAFLKCLTHVDIIRKPQHRKARQQFVGSKLTGAGGAAAANSPYRSTVIGGGFSGRKRVSFGASGGTGTGSSNYGGRGTLGAGLLGKSALSGLSSDTSGLTKSASFDPSLRNAGGLSYSKSVPKDSDGKSLLMKSVLDPNDETDALDELNEGLQNKSDTNRMTQAMRLDTDRSEPAPKDDEETPK